LLELVLHRYTRTSTDFFLPGAIPAWVCGLSWGRRWRLILFFGNGFSARKTERERFRTMGLDIRFPIGVLFTLFGLVLTVFGAFSNRGLYERSLGININLLWGVVLLLFGVAMLWLGRRRSVPQVTDETADLPPRPPKKQDAEHN